MPSFEMPICLSCSRLTMRGSDDKPLDFGPACAAFPDGIPEEIWLGGFDHRLEFEGDDGVRFDLAAGEKQALADYEAAT